MKAKINIGDKVRLNDEYGTTAIVERITGDCLTVKCQNGYNFWSVHSVAVVQTKEDIELNNDKEMKLKDLLKGRDKLRKYDELKEASKALKEVQADNGAPYDCVSYPYQLWAHARNGKRTRTTFTMQPYMLQLFIDALDAEIKKMEEE